MHEDDRLAAARLAMCIEEVRHAFRVRKATCSYARIAEASGVQVATLAKFNRGGLEGLVELTTLQRLVAWIDATDEDGTPRILQEQPHANADRS